MNNYDFNYNTMRERTLLLSIYEDENENKYIESNALRILLGLDRFHEFIDKNGTTIIITDTTLINKGTPEYAKYEKSYTPDLSDSFSYEEELGLYMIEENELLEIIKNYEAMNPGSKIEVRLHKVIANEIDKSKFIQNDELNILKDKYKFSTESVNNKIDNMFNDSKNENDNKKIR